MKYRSITSLLIALAISYVLTMALGDWRVAIIAGFIGGLFAQSRLKSFAAGFIGVLVAWLLMMAPILINVNNQKLLAVFASILGAPLYLPLTLLFILPAIVGGTSSLLATSIKLILART